MRGSLAVLLFVAACGGDGGAQPDAPPLVPDDVPADTPVYASCAEFSSAQVTVPAHVTGDLGTADVESPAACDEVDAPFGIETAGPDRVVPLGGLTPGMPYMVRLTSASDLSFYVASGCTTETGPAAAQCQLFTDASRGTQELGSFVATAATAYVIVDYWEPQAPASLAFTLDVYPQACASSAQCSGATPACFEGQCVECVSSFECTSALAPVCSASQLCEPGVDTCTTDDAAEPENDGPAGAAPIVLDGLGRSTLAQRICSSPRSELDYFSFDVTTLGETWDFQLAWSATRDLDLVIFDATGKQLGMSYWERPERIRLTYLPIGTYYARVREFASTANATSVLYSLTAQRTLGTGCAGVADCASEYRNQIYRGSCAAGACVAIAGAGAIAEGGACDSQSDCTTGLACPSFFFVADADTRDTCARTCTNDSECAPLGADYVCTTYLADNFCVAKCTENDHCPTATQSAPATVAPWARLRCELSTGRCVP